MHYGIIEVKVKRDYKLNIDVDNYLRDKKSYDKKIEREREMIGKGC